MSRDATKGRVANSHAYGVVLTHLTGYSRTHAMDTFTHAYKKITRILTQSKKDENNTPFLIIVTYCLFIFFCRIM